MPISGMVPTHLVVAAKSGFLAAVPNIKLPWQQIANQMPIGTKSQELVDLGAAPMPKKVVGRTQLQDYVERKLTVTPDSWELTVGLSYNAEQDDQTGSLLTKVKGAAENFQKHVNNLVFDALDKGDLATYGYCYDGLVFYSASHKDKGAQYQTNQSNLGALGLTFDNFKTTRIAASKLLDDQGEPVNFNHNLLVVPPDYEYEAAQITQNPARFATADRTVNPYSGKVDFVLSPKINSTAWFLVAGGESAKPIIVAMRENPTLQSAWFDPEGPDGGFYYFKYYARYVVVYGDWRLAFMGNT
jgi:phage major head subunit gpT-like protein